MGIELSNIGKVRAKRRLVMCYPGMGIDFIKDGLDVANGSRDSILHVDRNNISNRHGAY